MIFKIIGTIWLAIYYLWQVIKEIKKKDIDKGIVFRLSISLTIFYIIYLLLIWIIL